MEPLQYFLPQIWFFILGLFLFLYVLLDGFDLGVGILSQDLKISLGQFCLV